MIDCHCHLNDPCFDNDRDEVVARAGEIAIIDSGTDYKSCMKSMEISRKYMNVFSCLGLDPCLAEESGFERQAERIEKLIRENSNSIVGIGEVGLDFLRVKKNREIQEKVFVRFIRLAKELEKPVIVHSRWASKRAVEILSQEKAEKVMLHAFGGNLQELRTAIKNRHYVSITTRDSEHSREIIRNTPLSRLVTETDSPSMWEGRNEPKNIMRSIQNICEAKKAPEAGILKKTTCNAKKIFNLEIPIPK